MSRPERVSGWPTDEWQERGLKLRFHDPISLWGPGLLRHVGLEGAHLLRIYEFRVEFRQEPLELQQVRDPEDVARFWREVEAYNESVAAFNAARATLLARVGDYEASYDAVGADYANAYASYREEFLRKRREAEEAYRQDFYRYEASFSAWRAEDPNGRGAESARRAVDLDEFYPSPAPQRAIPARRAVEVPAALATLDGQRLLDEGARVQRRSVQVWVLAFMAELVDAHTGQIVWVGRATGSFTPRFGVAEEIGKQLVGALLRAK